MGASQERGSGPSPASAETGDAARYEIFATLGRGGMADVFLAVARGPRGFNKLVVIKKLRPHLTEDPAFREMFLDEARLAARLNHANVVLAYEVGDGPDGNFIAMEYLDGQPLNRLLEELRASGERMEPAIAARIVSEACSGLAHAHQLSDYDGTPLRIVHRDISPHNIFLTYDGQVKLVDFGIAKASLSQAETEVGVLKGKVAYMAPEQALGGDIDSRADLFSMGLVLWEMLTGRTLYNPDNAANTLHRIMNEPVPPPSSVVPGIDPALEAVVMHALEKNPEKRVASARQMRAGLEEWLQSTKRAVRSEECGALLTSRFEAARARVQGEIRSHMAGGESGHVSLGSLENAERNDGGTVAGIVDSGPGASTGLGVTRPGGGVSGGSRRRRIGLAFVTGALLLMLAVLLFIGRPRRDDRRAVAPTPADRPLASSAIAIPEPLPADSIPLPPFPIDPTDDATPNEGQATSRPTRSPAAPGRSHPSRIAASPAGSTSIPGYLTFDTYPWTRVSENGRLLGTTPLVHLALSPGAHMLTLDNPDLGIHQSYTATITGGESLTRRLGLR